MDFSGKVIFLNRFFYPDHSATSQLLSDLAFDLVQRGIPVAVITSRLRYDDPEAKLLPRESLQGVEVHRVTTSRFGRHFLPGRAIDYLTFHLGALWLLFRISCQGDVVVAKTDPPLISVTALPVVWLKRLRLINWVQDLFPEVAVALKVKGIRGPLAFLMKLKRNLSLKTARLNVALGERMAERLQGEGVAKERIRIIHNWSDGRSITPIPAAANPLRKEWGFRERFVVGYSGNLGRVHEFDTLLGAAEILRERGDILFLFIGGGAGIARLQGEVARKKLSGVRFQPYQPRERLPLSLGVADAHWISLLPDMEGLIVPSKFYGIAAAGRPVLFVGDHQGEIARLIEGADCGRTVSIGAAQALADEIIKLADDQGERVRMGQAARALFDARFDRPQALDAWHRLIQETRHP
ncbi:MAG: glycosyltransferase family 4 protein [Magnetococcales bacterium]|nr:glycosyltransferase family 4 protein [Magnetococcales bacterium]